MDGELIKSFLVGLGFGVDDASLAKFNKAIASASIKIAALYTGIQVAAAGIFAGISKMSEGFENIGYELRLVAPAINKMLILRQAMLSAYRAAGIDLTKVVRQSILFNYSLAKTKFALEAVYKSVGAKFLPLLTKQMDIFRAKIFANMPKIQEQLMKLVNFIFKAFDATVILGTRVWEILGRVWDFLKKLDVATSGWSTRILLFVAAWKLLNLEFLATPLGAIIAGIVALIALYDDFKVWQDGGKSFFNWASVLPTIQATKVILKSIWDIGEGLLRAMFDLYNLDGSGFLNDLKKVANAFIGISNAVDKIIRSFHIPLIDKILDWRDRVDASILGTAGPALSGIMQPSPIGPVGGAGVNQKVNQETNITVQGSADANAVGKAVASEQNKVNFDMTRNMKGAVR